MGEETLQLGSVIARRYELLQEIGRGGCAVVFEAYDHQIGQRVALKIPIRMADNTIKVSRFTRESRVLASIRHRHVCSVLDTGVTEDGMPFLVMERLYGESLRARLSRAPRMEISEVLTIGIQLLSALNAVHAAGIVHRDVKPDNIILVEREDGDLTVKLLDFGLCRRSNSEGEEETMTCEGSLIGTPEYMAPEQVIGSGSIDARVDLYAVAVVLYEALTGTRAFFANKLSDILSGVMHKKIVPLRQIRRDAPIALELILARSMERSPNRRHGTARDLQRDLRGVRAELAEREHMQTQMAMNRTPSSGIRARPPQATWELPTIKRFDHRPFRRTG